MTDLRGVDLARYRFDTDLTFAVLLMHPNGHVYHRYGARDERGAEVWISADSFRATLEAGLEAHEAYEPPAVPTAAPDPIRVEDVPVFAERDRGSCIHCHSAFESRYVQRRFDDALRPEDPWVYPSPARLGIDVDRDDQRRVTRVDADSPAGRAGVRVGDRLVRIAATSIATASDVMHALDGVPAAGGDLEVVVRRARVAHDEPGEPTRDAAGGGGTVDDDREGPAGDADLALTVALAPGWRVATPREFAWRPIKWALLPAPGFGGRVLDADERRAAGLADAPFAFRVDYFVDWGPRAFTGAAAKASGLRKGDVVHRVADVTDFDSIDHFHAWWRLTRRAGESVVVHYVRDGAQGRATVVVPDSSE